ncbi:MAG: aminopeptidase N [Actinobacteria bacterium]|nr:aminopeptidase N [Actinomycetota bacterium]MCA1719971.1 aminopeptidase N [Actinomycetota bacterium]
MPSLRQDEARTRAELLEVQRYDLDVDLTGLLEGDGFRSVSTVTFACREPGASTFVDCEAEVESAVLNGSPLPAAADGRIRLPDLQADNVLIVTSVQRNTGARTGVHRSVDASDGRVYVWTSFEPNEAHRAWACFDQPDLKAPHAFTVTAPADWMVLSSSGDASVSEVDDRRRWTFPETLPLSTYVPALNAGPFHEVRREAGGFDLGLYSRQSLAASLNRDADDMFNDTAAGLAFFGDQFGMPFPQRRYDQVFVPDLGGAMENYGCVTWSDAFLYRTPPSPGERELRSAVLLHEMAHMWFGDIVTMRWWDDLWLNEAFAEWACHWAAVAVTDHIDIWASFLAGWKLGGYAADRAPSRHPVRQEAVDVAAAAANFDNITYAKGASVLKQLVAYVGEDVFVGALRTYFAKHAWGNATLDDLLGELSAASGRDLAGWAKEWLERAGTDVLTLDGTTLRASGPDGTAPRPHRLDVGCYAGSSRRASLDVDLTGSSASLEGVAADDLLVVNDSDLTFAMVQLDSAAAARLLAAAPSLPTALSRTVAVTTGWQLLVTGSLDAAVFVEAAVRVLEVEETDSVVESVLALVVEAADLWSASADRDRLLSLVADVAVRLAARTGHAVVATRALAQTASSEGQLAALERLVGDDVDLRWRRLVRLAALSRVDAAEVSALAAEDPDPEAWVREMTVRTAAADPAAKQEAWEAVLSGTKVPLGASSALSRAFWQRSQEDLLAPFAARYAESLELMGKGGMIPSMVAAGALFPRVAIDAAGLAELVEAASAPGINPIVARTVVERADELQRMLAARG